MANDLSRALEAELGVGKDEWVYETTKQKAARERFEAIHNGLANTPAAKLARRNLDLSTRYPVHYLVVSQRLSKKAPAPPVDRLPKRLRAVRDLQEDDGRWLPSRKLTSLLGGILPDPPEGISDWRWTSVLTYVFLRRYPEWFDLLVETLEQAQDWAGDPALVELARRALPPLQAFVAKLDVEAIKQRKWSEAAKDLWDGNGYAKFLPKAEEMRTLGGTGVQSSNRVPGQSGRKRASFASTLSSPLTRPGTSSSGFRLFDNGTHIGDMSDAADSKLASSGRMSPSRSSKRRPSESAKSAGSGPDTDKLLGLVDDGPTAREVARRRARRRTKKQHKQGLEFEWKQAGKLHEHPFSSGEEVRVSWRRPDRWGTPGPTSELHCAFVIRGNRDGSVDVEFPDKWKEREFGIPRKHVLRKGEEGFKFDESGHRFKVEYKASRADQLRKRWESSVPQIKRENKILEDWKEEVYRRPEFGVRHQELDPRAATTRAAGFGQDPVKVAAARRQLRTTASAPALQRVRAGVTASTERRSATIAKPARTRRRRSNELHPRDAVASEHLRTETAAKSVLEEMHYDPTAPSRLPGVPTFSVKTSRKPQLGSARTVGEEVSRPSTAVSNVGVGAADEADDLSRWDNGDVATPVASTANLHDQWTPAKSWTSPADPLSQMVVEAILQHEKCCTKVLQAALQGANTWRTVRTNQEQLKAFDGTTAALQKCRYAAIRLCDVVAAWQKREINEGRGISGPASHVRDKHYFDKGPVFDGTGAIEKLPDYPGVEELEKLKVTMSRSEFEGSEDDPFSGAQMTARMKGPHRLPKPSTADGTYPPPFKWNGKCVLSTVSRSLDFLSGVPELVEWYTDAFPLMRNPFAISMPIDERPPTPRPRGRKVKKNMEMVWQDFPRCISENDWDQRVMDTYDTKMRKSMAPWWPTADLTEKDLENVRRAERLLLISEAAKEDGIAARA